jgi:two-component system chemotaxis response regulator CheY
LIFTADPGKRPAGNHERKGNVPKTVLIVDDSTSMRQMVGFTLRGAGYEVIEGSNGQEALDRLASSAGNKVDLVITDLNMPVMDGLKLTRQLRARPAMRFTPILILTTESTAERKAEGKAAGATGWIVKPFQPEQLLRILEKVLPI